MRTVAEDSLPASLPAGDYALIVVARASGGGSQLVIGEGADTISADSLDTRHEVQVASDYASGPQSSDFALNLTTEKAARWWGWAQIAVEPGAAPLTYYPAVHGGSTARLLAGAECAESRIDEQGPIRLEPQTISLATWGRNSSADLLADYEQALPVMGSSFVHAWLVIAVEVAPAIS